MRKKDPENEKLQRSQILSAAWKLFRQKGYEDTTLQDILTEAACSKGRFYYYFHAKAELLDSLYEVFDEKYEEVERALRPQDPVCEKLRTVHAFLFDFMSREVGTDLLSSLYRTQLEHKTGIDFWAPSRSFFRILRSIVEEGRSRGEIRRDVPTDDIVNDIIALERSCLLDWCLQNGSYPLTERSIRRVNIQLAGYRKCFEE